MVGTSAFDHVHPDDRDGLAARFSDLVAESGYVTDRYTHRLRHADGHWEWFESIGSNRTDTGLDGYVINSREVTERKTYERRLERQRDNLDLLNQMLGHDLRNDLQLVTAYAELLEEECEDETLRGYAETVRHSADHAVELTSTARALADVMLSPDADLEEVALRPALRDELEAVRSAHPHAGITTETTVPDATVEANDMLGSVFRNVLKNAVQHSDRDEPEVVVSATERPDAVVVRVADDGPGVPDDRKDEVFGKGEKGLESPGAGIGLYLVRTLVDSYGGDVWVEDNEPEGAVFVVELPKARRARRATGETASGRTDENVDVGE
jgi:signal transduction histidine kinase